MSSGVIPAVTDQGTMRLEGSVERRGVDPVVKVDVFDIGTEEFWLRSGAPIARTRAEARNARLELDPHEWAQFMCWVAQMNMRMHRELVAIQCEQREAQNATERHVKTLADVDPILKDSPAPMLRALERAVGPHHGPRAIVPLHHGERYSALEDGGPPACAQDLERPEAA